MRGQAVPLRGELWWAGTAVAGPGTDREEERVERLADRAQAPAAVEKGSQPRRVVLVVQIDDFNESRIGTVVCAVLTDDLRLAAAPGNVLVRSHASGLPQDMVCNVAQLITLGKVQLHERIGRLSPACLREVDAGLRLLLGI